VKIKEEIFMKSLIDVAEEVVMEINLAYSVLGEIQDYFIRTDESSRNDIKNRAETIYNLLVVVDKYIYDNKNVLQEAIDAYCHDNRG
jgi:hypothetical protein